MKNIHLLFALAAFIYYELPGSLASAQGEDATPSNSLSPVVSDLQSKLGNLHTQYLALCKELTEETAKENQAKEEAIQAAKAQEEASQAAKAQEEANQAAKATEETNLAAAAKNNNDNDGEIVLKLSSNLGTSQDSKGKTRIFSDSNSKIYGKNAHKYNIDSKRSADVRLKG